MFFVFNIDQINISTVTIEPIGEFSLFYRKHNQLLESRLFGVFEYVLIVGITLYQSFAFYYVIDQNNISTVAASTEIATDRISTSSNIYRNVLYLIFINKLKAN